jgi:LysM repeat protein
MTVAAALSAGEGAVDRSHIGAVRVTGRLGSPAERRSVGAALGVLSVVALAAGIALLGSRGGGPSAENASPSVTSPSSGRSVAAPSSADSAQPASAQTALSSAAQSSAPSIRPQATPGLMAPTPGPTFTKYFVRAGDNLVKIASQFNLQVWELELANPQIVDFNHIVVGQAINIPPVGLLPAEPS